MICVITRTVPSTVEINSPHCVEGIAPRILKLNVQPGRLLEVEVPTRLGRRSCRVVGLVVGRLRNQDGGVTSGSVGAHRPLGST